MTRNKLGDTMPHVMIDIETLGKSPGSVILSVGAVVFDIENGDAQHEFYDVIDIQSSINFGLKVDASTLLWWMSEEQEEARRDLVDELNGSPNLLPEVLSDLSGFIEEHTKDYDGKFVWANPPTFDLMILESAYDACGKEIPWKYYEMMDLRVLKNLYTGARPEFDIKGTKHNALYDAKLQAKICSHVWNWLKSCLVTTRKFMRERNRKATNPVTGSKYDVKEANHIIGTDEDTVEVECFIENMITQADVSIEEDHHRDFWKGYKKASQEILKWILE
jgi:hypothetical protein